MKCINCKNGTHNTILHRTNPKGQIEAGWMCMPCIEKTEPELAKDIKQELKTTKTKKT